MNPRKRKGGRRAKKGEPFSQVWATIPRAMHDAKVNGTEWAVMVCMLRYQVTKDGRVYLSRPAEVIAEEIGISAANVRKALAGLARKQFNCDGTMLPLLTRIKKAHTSRSAVYVLNVPRKPNDAPVSDAATDRERFQSEAHARALPIRSECASNQKPQQNVEETTGRAKNTPLPRRGIC